MMQFKQLLETFFKYSKEVFVIFIGVSISFLVDRCKNDFQDKESERQLLQNLRFDLQKDSSQLLAQVQFHKEGQLHLQKLYKNIDHIETIEDSVYIFVLGMMRSTAFTPLNITFEEIKQNGLSKILKNSALKRKVFELYCNDYEDLKIMNLKIGDHVDKITYPYLFQKLPFMSDNKLSKAQFAQVKTLCAEDAFKILLRSAVKDGKYNIEFYDQASKNVTNLLEMLRLELK